jgi:Helitron helicase-like domain at N-terminus
MDIARLTHNRSKTWMQTSQPNWNCTNGLLQKLTPEMLMDAANQAKKHKPITDPNIKELLKVVARVGGTSAGSDERKSHMLGELKSAIASHGSPILFLTINPADLFKRWKLERREEAIVSRNRARGGGGWIWKHGKGYCRNGKARV